MKSPGMRRRARILLDALEPRQYLSAWSGPHVWGHGPAINNNPKSQITLKVAPAHKKNSVTPAIAAPPSNAYSPIQITHVYGMDHVAFGSIAGDGTGQTIAIIDAFDDPNALSDLQAFDQAFNLPDPPSFLRVNQLGQTSNYPNQYNATDNPTYGWQLEESLDIEWAHVMAPGANIILVECNSTSDNDLISAGVNWARNQPGVSVISMSFGSSGEFPGETIYDQYFTTPGTHNGVTFVASTGDTGKPGGYPAFSPNVVAVGGTSLTINSDGSYGGETGWNDSGGGPGVDENQPSYQSSVQPSNTKRAAPDIALDGDPSTGVAVYDSFNNSGWLKVGGTSLAAPLFAGMIAVANQGRALAGKNTLDSRNDTLPMIYAHAADFRDITAGNNGYPAGIGYDYVTGLGTPQANLLIPDLVGVIGSISGRAYADNNGDGSFDAGDSPLAGVTVYLDQNDNGLLDIGGTQTQSQATHLSIPDNATSGVSSPITIANLNGAITGISLTLNITHARDNNLVATLTGPDGTQITLFSGVGGFGQNFTGTVFNDNATTNINSGVAPFIGTYGPATPLSTFNGKSADGTWTLTVADTRRSNTGSFDSWAIAITTATDPSTVTASDGSYTFASLPAGNYTVREVAPAGYVDSGIPSATEHLTGDIAGVDFANSPTAFSATASGQSFYLYLSGNMLDISTNGTPANPAYQLPASLISSLSFHLTTASTLIVDYSSGDPVPDQLLVDGGGLATSQLDILGGPAPIAMTDTTLGIAGGGVITYANLGTLTFNDATVHFVGTLSTLQTLNLHNHTTFYWDG